MTSRVQTAADKLIGKIDQLHSAPQIAQKILGLTRNPNFNIDEVTKCLENDPAMAARILRVVNSSRYGLRQKVANIKQATVFIGQRSLRLITLTFGLLETLTHGIAEKLYLDYWRRALTMATVASRFAAEEGSIPQEDAYTAGLLADMGVLLFSQEYTDEYATLYDSVPHGPELLKLEQEHFGCDHATVGARLLEHWELPEELVTAVLYHHTFRGEAEPLERTIQIGDRTAEAFWSDESDDCILLVKSVLEGELGYNTDEFLNFVKLCREEFAENAELFGLKFDDLISMDHLLELEQIS